METFSGIKTSSGERVFSQEYIGALRQQAIAGTLRNAIVPQAGGQEDMLSANVDILIAGGSRGGPLVTDTKVVTPFGYRKMGDLKAGDIISGTDGGMQRVVYKTDHGKLPCYKLKFIDGSEITASYDHLWNVRKTCYRSKKRILNGLSLTDDYRVWTTQMIVEHLAKQKNGEIKNSRLVIPLCEPVKFTVSDADYGIDPYLLGIILGDGCITNCVIKHDNIVFSTKDAEIVQAFKEGGYADVHMRTAYKPIDFIFKSSGFVNAIKKWKLAGHRAEDKFVPRVFKFGTIEERLAVLQGLMDTDGTIDKRGHCSFTTVSKQLADDVKFLVNSLGGLATISKGESFYTFNGKRMQGKDAYHVYIRIKDSARIFRLPRKKALATEYNGGVSEVVRHIVDYEYVGEKEVCCIAVNNTNSLFMVEDFVVTHNSKSFSLLLDAMKDIQSPDFHAAIFRGNKREMEKLIRDSRKLYSQYGTYNRAQNDMTWNFYNGGSLGFFYHDGSDDDFKERFQGQEYDYIAIDEITHISYKKFKYLWTCNRGASSIRKRMWGTCNPDPRSWVRQFIDWWIDKDGYIDPERNGKVRYCYMKGDRVSQIVWGSTREEVYEKVKDDIKDTLNEGYSQWDLDILDSIVSVAFVRADLSQNPMLLLKDKNYLKKLMQQDKGQVLRDLKANWNATEAGDDMISYDDLEAVFHNSYQYGDGIRRCTADIALEGGDNLVMYLWIGWHVADFRCMNVNSKTAVSAVKHVLREWGVPEENFCYDYQGVGQLIKGFFPESLPFNNQAAPISDDDEYDDGVKFLYKDLKSQCAYLTYRKLKELGISFENDLLDRKVSGNGYEDILLRDVLQKERQSLRRETDSQDKGFCLMQKKKSKLIVGHSPDWWESLYFRAYFDIAEPAQLEVQNGWMLGASMEMDFDMAF